MSGQETSNRAVRLAALVATGALVLGMGGYAAIVSSPSLAAGPGDRSTPSCAPTAKPRPVWHGDKSLSVSPDNPVPGERVRLRGKFAKPLPRGATVRVQLQRQGGPWQTVHKHASINRHGSWHARFQAPTKKSQLSVRAQLLDRHSRVVSTSKRQRLRMTRLRVSLQVPDELAADAPWQATVRISPARPGTRVTLQVRARNGGDGGRSHRGPADSWFSVYTVQPAPLLGTTISLFSILMPTFQTMFAYPFFEPLAFQLRIILGVYGQISIVPFFHPVFVWPPDPEPTETPTPTVAPTPSDLPTEDPTDDPTLTEDPTPTEDPTDDPTATEDPTEEPTDGPTDDPTPTEDPTDPLRIPSTACTTG